MQAKLSKEQIAEKIIQECFWDNTNLNANEILSRIDEYDFAKQIFSAVFENSKNMYQALGIIKKEWVKSFIQNQRIGNFKKDYLQARLDALYCIYIDPNHQIRGWGWKI